MKGPGSVHSPTAKKSHVGRLALLSPQVQGQTPQVAVALMTLRPGPERGRTLSLTQPGVCSRAPSMCTSGFGPSRSGSPAGCCRDPQELSELPGPSLRAPVGSGWREALCPSRTQDGSERSPGHEITRWLEETMQLVSE